ncbi:MAG TPA: hypothetical protein VJS44_06990 [Pyrinomonadaceae bacterium]|nr:hypothetical protein [Pyrinomonadaceae bacterium]
MARGHDPRIHETPDASDIRNPDITHEVSDVNTRGILWFVLFLAGLIVVALLLLRGMYNVFEAMARTAEGERPVMARTTEERYPPEPRLQAAPGYKVEGENLELKEPQAELKVVRRKWQTELESYGIVDPDQKIARIPIEEAIKQVAREGIKPVSATQSGGQQQQQQQGQTQTKQTPAPAQPSDSSSGRQSERRQP